MLVVANAAGQQFQLMEASINEIHRGLQSGKLTCHSLVQQYLDRIQAYDQQGPTLNAMLYVNPNVLEQADAMDKQLKLGTEHGTKLGAQLKPLQCIPVVLKDNLRHRRYADHRRIARTQGHAAGEGCVHGDAAPGKRSADSRESEHA